MKRIALIGLGAASCLALMTSIATARDENPAVPDVKLSDLKLGEHVSGEETDLKRLRGKVVAIEYWGTR